MRAKQGRKRGEQGRNKLRLLLEKVYNRRVVRINQVQRVISITKAGYCAICLPVACIQSLFYNVLS